MDNFKKRSFCSLSVTCRNLTVIYRNRPSFAQKPEYWLPTVPCRNPSLILSGARRHAHEDWHEIRYRYIHLYVRLEEGEGPGYKVR